MNETCAVVMGLFGLLILFVLVVMGFDYVTTHDTPVVTLAITVMPDAETVSSDYPTTNLMTR